jgi:hypothetical protein
MNNLKVISLICMLCAFIGSVASAGTNEIKDTNDTWLFGKREKGKDIVNPSNRIVTEVGNLSYKEINSNPDRFVIGFDTDEFFTPYRKYFNSIILTKENNGIDLKLRFKGAQFVGKDPAWATSGKTMMYMAYFDFEIFFSKPVKTVGAVISNITNQDWVACFYNGKTLLKEEKVVSPKNKFAFVAFQSDKANITHVWLKRTNTKSKRAGYVDDLVIIP